MPRTLRSEDAARYDDPDGTELPDDAAARDYAIRVIREVPARRDGRWRSGSATALCGKSPLERWSQITMAEAPIALRTVHRGGCCAGEIFDGALCLCSPSLQLCCLARRRGRHGTAGRRGCARVRCESDEWTGVAKRRQLGGLDDGGLAGRPPGMAPSVRSDRAAQSSLVKRTSAGVVVAPRNSASRLLPSFSRPAIKLRCWSDGTAPGSSEAIWFESRRHGRLWPACVVTFLGFGRRDVADGLQETPVVEPVHPFQRRELDGF